MSILSVAVVEHWLRGSDAEALRWFASSRGDVVVEQRAWQAAPDSIVVDEQLAAAVFHVRDGRIIEHTRYAALDEALRATALTPDDEVLARVG